MATYSRKQARVRGKLQSMLEGNDNSATFAFDLISPPVSAPPGGKARPRSSRAGPKQLHSKTHIPAWISGLTERRNRGGRSDGRAPAVAHQLPKQPLVEADSPPMTRKTSQHEPVSPASVTEQASPMPADSELPPVKWFSNVLEKPSRAPVRRARRVAFRPAAHLDDRVEYHTTSPPLRVNRWNSIRVTASKAAAFAATARWPQAPTVATRNVSWPPAELARSANSTPSANASSLPLAPAKLVPTSSAFDLSEFQADPMREMPRVDEEAQSVASSLPGSSSHGPQTPSMDEAEPGESPSCGADGELMARLVPPDAGPAAMDWDSDTTADEAEEQQKHASVVVVDAALLSSKVAVQRLSTSRERSPPVSPRGSGWTSQSSTPETSPVATKVTKKLRRQSTPAAKPTMRASPPIPTPAAHAAPSRQRPVLLRMLEGTAGPGALQVTSAAARAEATCGGFSVEEEEPWGMLRGVRARRRARLFPTESFSVPLPIHS
jgi:hypothetical protein